MTKEHLQAKTKEQVLEFIRQRLSYSSIKNNLRHINMETFKKEHKRFEMSGYESNTGECTTSNLDILNEFANIGIYNYTNYLFLEFYKGCGTLYFKYFGETENIELELSGLIWKKYQKDKNMWKWLNAILIILTIVGCATKYQSSSFSGGYSETRLGDNIFNVSFLGNGFTSKERTSDFTLLRSAELSLRHGFKYFIVTNSEKHTSTHTAQSGGITVRKPSANNTIVCFKEKPKINGLIYEANFIIQSIKEKYNIK